MKKKKQFSVDLCIPYAHCLSFNFVNTLFPIYPCVRDNVCLILRKSEKIAIKCVLMV